MRMNRGDIPDGADVRSKPCDEDGYNAEAKAKLSPKPKYVLRIGSKVGRLTLIEATTERIVSSNGCRYKRRMWRCDCECGKRIVTQEAGLRAGKTRSCGCLSREIRSTRGGASRQSRLYHAWQRMLRRCYSPRNRGWQHCGARGIRVCDRWQGPNGLDNFIADIGPQPSPRHRLTRIDPDGHYEPANYGWTLPGAFRATRRPHKRRLLTYRGETHSVSDWAQRIGISRVGLLCRLAKTNDPEKLFAPPRRRRRTGEGKRACGRADPGALDVTGSAVAKSAVAGRLC